MYRCRLISNFPIEMLRIIIIFSSKAVDEEWDNPFQPEGEVSHDADLIIQLWKGRKLSDNCEDLHENMKTLALDTTEDSEESDDTPSDTTDSQKCNGSNGTHETTPAPVINNSDSINYIVIMNNEAEKHKNKIKKHCNLM